MQDPDIMAGMTHRETTPVEGFRLDPSTGFYLPAPKKHSRQQTPEQRQTAIDKAVAKRLRKMEKRRDRRDS